ncbi:MAG: iron ABC transporter permease, partial [Nitratireductor sp.]
MTAQTVSHDVIAAAPVARRDRHVAALLPAIVIAGLAVLPIAVVIAIALTGTGEDWPHLVRNVLPGATATTMALLAMVAVGTATNG